MKKYLQYRQDLKTPNGKYPTFSDISHKLCYEIEEIWKKASLPTVTHEQAVKLLRSFHKKYNTILKSYKERKDRPSYQQKLSDFRLKANFPFDLCKCKCAKTDDMFNCKCPKEHKVPAKERAFLEDQRGLRRMKIGGIDKKETSRLKRRADRKMSKLQQSKKVKTIEL